MQKIIAIIVTTIMTGLFVAFFGGYLIWIGDNLVTVKEDVASIKTTLEFILAPRDVAEK